MGTVKIKEKGIEYDLKRILVITDPVQEVHITIIGIPELVLKGADFDQDMHYKSKTELVTKLESELVKKEERESKKSPTS